MSRKSSIYQIEGPAEALKPFGPVADPTPLSQDVDDKLPGTTAETEALRADENNIAKNAADVVKFTPMLPADDIANAAPAETVEEFQRTISSQAAFLTATDFKVKAEAERRASVNKTVADLASAPDKPMLYKDKPFGQDLVTFLRREYRDRGLLSSDFDRSFLKKYDPSCLRAIETFEYKHDLLPEDVRIPKAKQRTSARERILTKS